MKVLKYLTLASLAVLVTTPAHAAVRAVAATDTLGWVVKSIGGDHVQVEALAHGDQDPHQINARPSQVVKLAQADMLVRIGMDLDLWLDPIVDAARNPKVNRGAKGYVDAHLGLHALELP